ncbi:MAG: hypothetical protein AB1782_06010 [Cyanobacteriota bacterium]
MKYENRKNYPDIEEFSPEEWEVVEEVEAPGFIKDAVEQAQTNISNRGGRREGAGRPFGSVKGPTNQIRLPEDVVEWIRADKEENILKIRKLMSEFGH